MDSRGAPFLLTVKSGLHAGVVQQLPAGDYTLGGGPTADILFSDPGIGAEHVAVTLKSSLFGAQAVIRAQFPGVAVNGQRINDASQSRTTRLPVDVQFGDIRVAFAGRPEAPLSPMLLGGVSAAVLVLFLAGAILIFGPKPRPPEVAPATAVAEAPSAQRVTETRLAPAKVLAPSTSSDFALQELRQRLQETQLSYQIRTTLDGNTIQATGAVGGEDRTRWQEVRYWYDQTYGTNVPMHSTVELNAQPGEQGLQISAVSLNTPSYIVTRTGTRYLEGDNLTGGWILEKIEDSRVILRRDSEKLVISF
jgi:hypothetical protein